MSAGSPTRERGDHLLFAIQIAGGDHYDPFLFAPRS
jgi:hypothetical protein